MGNCIKKILCGISPKLTTYMMYLYNFGKPLNLTKPQNINEKLQYLKLYTYYENPVITRCVDKLRVRDYLTEKGYGFLLPNFLGGVLDGRGDSKGLACFSESVCHKVQSRVWL